MKIELEKWKKNWNDNKVEKMAHFSEIKLEPV